MATKMAPGLILVVAFVLSTAGWANLATVAPVLLAARQAKPQPQRPPDPPELVEALAQEKEALDRLETVVRGYLWPASEAERAQASIWRKSSAEAAPTTRP